MFLYTRYANVSSRLQIASGREVAMQGRSKVMRRCGMDFAHSRGRYRVTWSHGRINKHTNTFSFPLGDEGPAGFLCCFSFSPVHTEAERDAVKAESD